MKTPNSIKTALICLFLATACGQKGPLYLEKEAQLDQATEQPTTNQTIEKTETTK